MPLSNTGVDRYLAQNYYSKSQLNSGQLDTRYFAESEFVNTSAGAGDSGKPVKLNSSGKIDATMITDSDIDHGSTGGLSDDDHTQYALLAGRAGGSTLYGGTGANDDITIHGTSHATRTSSYVIIQPTAGGVVVGGTSTSYKMEVVGTFNAGSTITQNGVAVATLTDAQTLTQKKLTLPVLLSTAAKATAATTTVATVASADTNGSDDLVIYFRLAGSATAGSRRGTIGAYENNAGSRDLILQELGGNVGINKAPTTALDVDGTVTATAGAFTTATVGGVAVVTTTASQTLTNKTLTAPVIATISNTGTLTLPTSTDTLVGRATTDTLTNKTLTSPTITTPTITTSAVVPLVYGGTAANDDLILHGTSNATRTTSYINLNPSGGKTVVGGSTADYRFEVQDAGASNYRMTFNLNDTSENVLGSINDVVGSFTQAPLRIFASRIRFNGVPNIMTFTSPASSSTGTAGDIAADTTYLYFCYATNLWGRIALSKGY